VVVLGLAFWVYHLRVLGVWHWVLMALVIVLDYQNFEYSFHVHFTYAMFISLNLVS